MNQEMKRLILLPLVFIAFLGVGFLLANSQNLLQIKPTGKVIAAESLPPPSPLPDIIENPKTLSIPKLGINTVIESVGNDSVGRMDVPKQAQNVAWYNLGFKVGEVGSAVLAGHFDDTSGKPAVFYHLNQLTEGDEVVVSDDKGKRMVYKVTKMLVYDEDKVPLMDIFNSPDKSRLNLITCDGIYDASSNSYSRRMVVYTEKVTP